MQQTFSPELTAARLAPLLETLHSLLARQNRVVIGMDGCCASGKTTAANYLAQTMQAGVVHMDDFFLPNELRTPARLAEAGGNVHYERFSAEVLPFLHGTAEFSYRKFSCSLRDFEGSVTVPAARLIVVEGAYSLHPLFGQPYDLRVLSTISPAEQENRIRLRNGEDGWQRFSSLWIPMENRYLKEFSIRESCDLIL